MSALLFLRDNPVPLTVPEEDALMAAVMVDRAPGGMQVAAPLPRLRWRNDREALEAALAALRCSLAREAVDDLMFEDLEAVLGEHARPTPQQIGAIAERFRKATTKLVEFVPHLVKPYPLDEIMRLIHLSAEHPCSEYAHGHLRRFALAVLALIDLMGDDAE
ncbi:DUF6415 family natural product biosynthesis protein [Streptomyces ipomoeae]|uniref:DUF6415 family natural product biosynthesis protein n=1 Tax=Streptomyces ipomoeae TaxID=103232 RepID=UPI001146232C|nr:DUF6415 family natural product biosynthesis protein [Streptomyces ipomoeae]MDX2935985.1 DUF6415 family natural product biosynthesis protein [Streptomyces ipomoeae]TQE14754.1 hypothetical protein SipoB123_45910 [Streptomyces ipomoeae]